MNEHEHNAGTILLQIFENIFGNVFIGSVTFINTFIENRIFCKFTQSRPFKQTERYVGFLDGIPVSLQTFLKRTFWKCKIHTK